MAPLACPRAADSLFLCLDANYARAVRLWALSTCCCSLLASLWACIVGKSCIEGSRLRLAGNVLVPVDAVGFVTELLLMLEAARAVLLALSCHLAGNVLVPVDAAGRVLELLLVLEAAWAGARPGYGLALLSPVAFNALEFAKSQLEWMAEGLTHSLERSKANPFALRCAVNLEPKTYYLKPQPGAQQG